MSDLNSYTDREIYEEYLKRENARKIREKEKEETAEKERITWLENNGGTDGNDQCATSYCRIYCSGCD